MKDLLEFLAVAGVMMLMGIVLFIPIFLTIYSITK